MSTSSVDVEYPIVSWFTEKPNTPTDFPYNKDCSDIRYEYDLATAIVCGVCSVFGIIFVFFGKYLYITLRVLFSLPPLEKTWICFFL